MKRTFISLLFICTAFSALRAQTRYFEFVTTCGHGDWRDTSFIAATDRISLIDSVLLELNKPYEIRNFISGTIAAGNAGYNRNATHWFKWHFVPGEWRLAEFAVEVCDGCPYTDVDSDTSYWLRTIGFFCPWSGRPVREVTHLMPVDEPAPIDAIVVYPNPAVERIRLAGLPAGGATLRVFDATGAEVRSFTAGGQTAELDLNGLPGGIYFLHVHDGHSTIVKKIMIGG